MVDNPRTVAHGDAAAELRRRWPATPSRVFGPAARQKLLAFASLILLLVYFGFASPAFMQIENILGILQATAVSRRARRWPALSSSSPAASIFPSAR